MVCTEQLALPALAVTGRTPPSLCTEPLRRNLGGSQADAHWEGSVFLTSWTKVGWLSVWHPLGAPGRWRSRAPHSARGPPGVVVRPAGERAGVRDGAPDRPYCWPRSCALQRPPNAPMSRGSTKVYSFTAHGQDVVANDRDLPLHPALLGWPTRGEHGNDEPVVRGDCRRVRVQRHRLPQADLPAHHGLGEVLVRSWCGRRRCCPGPR